MLVRNRIRNLLVRTKPLPRSLSGVVLTALLWCVVCLPTPAESRGEDLSPGAARDILNNGVGVAELDTVAILDRKPFDRLVLDVESNNAVFDIRPISPEARNETSEPLIFTMIDEYKEGRQYIVDRSHIVKILSYPQLILEEATKWMETDAKDEFEERDNLVKAFLHYDFLMHHREFRGRSDVLAATRVYLYTDAYNQIRQKRFAEALSVLEVLYKLDRDYKPSSNKLPVKDLMQGTFAKLIDELVDRHDYRLAEQYMDDVDDRYRDAFKKTTDAKRQRITELALEYKVKAEKLLAEDKGREAYDAVRQMRNISPKEPALREIEAQVVDKYPMVIVGTSQEAKRPHPRSMHNWASRRVGKLYYNTLVQYAGQGEDGGIYRFANGRIERADNWLSMDFVIKRFDERPDMPYVDSYFIYDRLRQLSDRESPEYVSAWAQLQETIKVVDPERIHIKLRRAHVLPESLLQVPLVAIPDKGELPPPNGVYELESSDEDGSLYRPLTSGIAIGDTNETAAPSSQQDREVSTSVSAGSKDSDSLPRILERHFDNRDDLLSELKRGDIDVIDRIFPADYRQLKSHPYVIMRRYAVPTVHMLIPNLKNEYLQNAVFRKAILHAIDRESILKKEILANSDMPGCSVVSGPFPMGFGESDPISYGYNSAVEPAIADSYHSAILLLLANSQIKDQRVAKEKEERRDENREREKQGKEPLNDVDEDKVRDQPLPEKKLIIALPDNAIASFGCNLIKQDLKLIGVTVELRKLPPGETVPPDDKYDLLYVEIVMEEPLVDARTLLVDSGLVTDLTSPVEHALRELDSATSWSDARKRLHDLHFQCDSETIVLPLWQITEHYAYRRNVQGISRSRSRSTSRPGVTNFYENVENWRIVPGSPAK